jgi:hypothetical protein
MQLASLAVLRAVASSGHYQKLAVAFSHFDQVKGLNLPGYVEKRAHVLASVTNGLSNLSEVLGAPIVKAVEHVLEGQCFMLGALQEADPKLLDDEYDMLRPVADLVARLTERISLFLDNPLRWTREPVDDDEAQAAISGIRQGVFAALHELIADRLLEAHLQDWRVAFNYSGKGSTFDRARNIRDIYEAAAPVPGVVVTPLSVQFLKDIRNIVHRAVEDNGGELELASVA